MKFYFSPNNENCFKAKAVGNFVKTLIFDEEKNDVHKYYSRKVRKVWKQSVKNNIESDHRVKNLPSGNYQIYSWVAAEEANLGLPNFKQCH